MKKLFVLMLVGLCSQGFCMAPGATPNGENVENTREQMVMRELNDLADYFANNVEIETPVESATQAFREISNCVQNIRTFDQDQMQSLGIAAYNRLIGANESLDYGWLSSLKDIEVDDEEDAALAARISALQNGMVYNDEDSSSDVWGILLQESDSDEEENSASDEERFLAQNGIVYSDEEEDAAYDDAVFEIVYIDEEEDFISDEEELNSAAIRLKNIYTRHFVFMSELYNVFEIFMRNIVEDRVNEGQSRLISRICKGIQNSGGICDRVGPHLKELLQENS